MNFLKSTFKQIMISAVIYAVIGLVFILNPGMALKTIGRIIALGLLIVGIIKTVFYFTEKNYSGIQRNTMTSGIILIVLGIFMLFKQDTVATIVGYILGFIIVISGIVKFQHAADLHHFGSNKSVIAAVMGIVSVVLGIIALVNPFSASTALLTMIGISMIITAIGDFVNAFYMYKCIKKAEKDIIDV